MKPDDAKMLAQQLMRHYHLHDWTFAWNRRKRALGMCFWGKKQIELSLPFVQRNDEAAVRDTILHEIAHALAGQKAGHGPAWKRICRQIGATPERCDNTAEMPKGKWVAKCPGCQKEFSRHRRPLKKARYSCRTCGLAKGELKFYMNLPPAPPRKVRVAKVAKPIASPNMMSRFLQAAKQLGLFN